MFKKKDTVKFVKTKRIALVGQEHSSIKVVRSKFFITMNLVNENGTFVTSPRLLNPLFFPKFLQRAVVKLSLSRTKRIEKKFLKLDKELGKKKQG